MDPLDLKHIRPKLERRFESTHEALLPPTMLALLAQLNEAEEELRCGNRAVQRNSSHRNFIAQPSKP